MFAQTKNVTNLVKPYNTDSEIKIVGATLENTDIHLTIKLNDSSTKWVEALNSMFGKSKTASEIRTEKVMEFFYRISRKVFKKVTGAETIILYVATFTATRDGYGNKTGEIKRLEAMFSLYRTTTEKLNWKYINELLNKSDSKQELLSFLDSYEFLTSEYE
jgi:hypothetical protein